MPKAKDTIRRDVRALSAEELDAMNYIARMVRLHSETGEGQRPPAFRRLLREIGRGRAHRVELACILAS